MTLEHGAMNSVYGLQFLNLDDATEEQKQHISDILFRSAERPPVEFPWDAAASWKSVSDDSVTTESEHYDQQSYSDLSSGGNQGFLASAEDLSFQGMPVVSPQEAQCHPSVLCLSHGGSMAPVPSIQDAMPVFALPDMAVQRSMLPISADAKLYNVSPPMPKTMVGAYAANKSESADSKTHHRRNKKKRPPEYFEKFNHMQQPAMDFNMLDEASVAPIPHPPPHMTHSISVPVSLSAQDPQNLSQPPPVPFTCTMSHMTGHIEGPSGTCIPHPFPGIQQFYTSPVIYPGGMCLMPSNVYPPPYATNYPSHPHGSLAHIVVPTEQTVMCGSLHPSMAPDVSPSGHHMEPAIVSDVSVPSQVPNEIYSQEKVTGCNPEPLRTEECDLCVISNVEDRVNATTYVDIDVANGPVDNKSKSDANVSVESESESVHSDSLFANSSIQSKSDLGAVNKEVTSATNKGRKSWASLFTPNREPVNFVSPALSNDGVDLINKNHREESILVSDIKESVPVELRDLLSTIQLDHHSVHFVPRGLSNKGNWCYINATLQALLACPPFYNLMKRLPVVPGLKKGNSTVPVIDAVVEFVHEFVSIEHFQMKPKNNVRSPVNKVNEELMIGDPFEPTYIFDMLKKSKSDTFTKGRQEDAEEFLSWILNKVHEEMVELKSNTVGDGMKNGSSASNGDIANHLHEDGTDDSEWLVIDHKNKGCTTREIPCRPSPIQDIFGGQMCSMLQHAGANKSKTLQPFFTLQLDIQAENVTCIKSALNGLVERESLQGFTSDSTNLEVEASRRITLEKLPTVLILHLKRFVFDRNGGCRKLFKRIDFDFALELNKDLLSSSARITEKNRNYRLFAVVYHDGQEAAKGHYITDVYHYGYQCWLRADDAKVKSIADGYVLKHDPPRVPYLLYYRRDDTIL